MEVLSRDQKELDSGAKAFAWIKFMSKCLGIWSLNPNYYLSNLIFLYFTYAMFTEYVNLFYCLPNLKKVIGNLTETLSFTHIYVRTVILRVYIKTLGEVMSECLKDYQKQAYKNSEEIYELLSFIKKGKLYVKCASIFSFWTISSWFLKPVTLGLASPPQGNSTFNRTMYLLPYKFHVFYEINSYKTYILTYISWSPFAFIVGFGHVTSGCFLIILTFHVSGKLAVLATRIDALKYKSRNIRKELNEIIYEHSRLLRMGEGIKRAYAPSLLIYFVNGSILLTFIGFRILVSWTVKDNKNLTPYYVFISTVYLAMCVFCTLSENLISQSKKVSNAFYQCQWYNMPNNCAKDVIFCIKRSQKSLCLTAGPFVTLGNSTLTDVTKTALGYLSVLRSFMVSEQSLT